MAKVKRRDLRQERKMARIEGRQASRDARIAGRTERAASRSATKQAAYEAGIDPNAWVGDVTDLAGDALGMFAGSKDNKKNANSIKDPSKAGSDGAGDEKKGIGDWLADMQAGKQQQKNLLIGGAVLVALVVLPNLLKRKR